MANMIITRNHPLHPANVNFQLPVAGQNFNGEQLYRIIEGKQNGHEDLGVSFRDEIWCQRPCDLRKVPIPRQIAPYIARQWVDNRSLVRRGIFAAAVTDVLGFNDALTQAATDMQFLVADDTPRHLANNHYDYWNTAANSTSLYISGGVGCFGRNMMGHDLALVKAGDKPHLDLNSWMNMDHCSSPGPPYGFMIIGDYALRFLEIIESGVLLVKNGLRFQDTLYWLNIPHFAAKFKNIVIHAGLADISAGNPVAIERAFRHIAERVADRSNSVYISAPLPQPFSVCSSDTFLRFKDHLRQLSLHHRFQWIDSDMRVGTTFRVSASTAQPHFYSGDKLNFNGTRELIRLWESFIPELANYEIGFNRSSYEYHTFRASACPRFMLSGRYARPGSVYDLPAVLPPHPAP